MNDYQWSHREKAVCRKAFYAALEDELTSTITEFKTRVAAISTPDEMWAIEEFLRERRKEIDWKYDYRYSQLIRVFGHLLREGRISEEQLEGLADEKLERIRRIASL